MARSGVLERSIQTLEDLDAFVDESINAKDEKQIGTFKKVAKRIMADCRRRSTKRQAVPRTADEKARSAG
jgi:hypothetical protein